MKKQRPIEEDQVGRLIANKYRQQRLRLRGMRWSKSDVAQATRLHHKSPSAYRLLRKEWQLPLPSESVLKRCSREFFKTPGVCNLTLGSLSDYLVQAEDSARIATLCFDGMSLSPSVRYDESRDEISGYDSRSGQPKVVNEAVVGVLRGVKANWKQPIAYYPVHSTLGQQGFSAAITECLQACHCAGIQVVAIIADQESSQWAHLSRQVSQQKPYIDHPVSKEPVFVVIDVPHCLKNARNALMRNNIRFDDNKVARWSDLVEFYNADSCRDLRLACKLSDLHFTLRLGKKMKVSLAAQVLSHSVSAGIRTLVHHGEMTDDCLHTADFVQKLDAAFDRVNSSNAGDRGLRRPIFSDTVDKQLEELSAVADFINSWCFLPLTGRKEKSTMKFKAGWLLSLESLRRLAKELIDRHGFRYVCLRRFTQDHVEVSYFMLQHAGLEKVFCNVILSVSLLQNLFCIIRGHNGFNDRPSLAAFVGALRSVAASGLARLDSQSANCEDDECSSAVTAANATSPQVIAHGSERSGAAAAAVDVAEGTDESVSELPIQDEPDSVLQDAVEYVGGFVVRKSSCLSCDLCRTALTGEVASGAFVRLKEYSWATRGLVKLSPAALQAFSKMEAVFMQQMPAMIRDGQLRSRIVAAWQRAGIQVPACASHRRIVWQRIGQKYARLRLHHWCRLEMRRFRSVACGVAAQKKLRKLGGGPVRLCQLLLEGC
jgi:hypothetical protein